MSCCSNASDAARDTTGYQRDFPMSNIQHFIELGNQAKSRHDPEEALACFERGLQLEPENVELLYLAGDTLHDLGEFGRAAAYLQKASRIDPRHVASVYTLAVALHDLGRLEEAIAAYQAAAALRRDHTKTHNNLGSAYLRLGRVDEAIPSLERALQLDPDNFMAHYNLGSAYYLKKNYPDARQHFQAAVTLRPDFAQAHNNFANLLKEEGDMRGAMEHYQQAIQYDPDLKEAYPNLAEVLMHLGRQEEARAAYRRSLQLQPDDVVTRHLLNALENVTPQRPDPEYVRAVFDHYAGTFENHLRDDLKYDVPYKLRELLGGQFPERKFESMLDMGCGTGLSGVPMRDLVRRMAGVDLSEKMLEQARQKQVYDELHAADLIGYLKQSGDAAFDLLLSADVFLYLGDLAPVFAEARRVLQAGGILAYSTEAADGGEVGELGYKLETSGRYAHHAGYLRGLGERHGFRELHFSSDTIRYNFNQPVAGHLVILQKV
ncbi:MAG: tetratricopeptide repeat protein [Pseudomonadota bacterium]